MRTDVGAMPAMRRATKNRWRHVTAVAALVGLGMIGAGSAVVSSAPARGAAPSIGGFTRVAEVSVARGKPVPVFFLSALYCPFCAAERWALVEALGRFGTWTHLTPSQSTGGVDGFAPIPTYDFTHARYTSHLVAFTARDIADARGSPLEPLQPDEKVWVNRYDPEGSIPFLLVAGAFARQGSGFSPGLLVGKSFERVRADLAGDAPDGRAIRREADVLTALICVADGGAPRAVCGVPAVENLEGQVH